MTESLAESMAWASEAALSLTTPERGSCQSAAKFTIDSVVADLLELTTRARMSGCCVATLLRTTIWLRASGSLTCPLLPTGSEETKEIPRAKERFEESTALPCQRSTAGPGPEQPVAAARISAAAAAFPAGNVSPKERRPFGLGFGGGGSTGLMGNNGLRLLVSNSAPSSWADVSPRGFLLSIDIHLLAKRIVGGVYSGALGNGSEGRTIRDEGN